MSKGGDSSDSATTQTPAQWAAALSNTSIAAWKEADILAISLDKLQALSATQISQITVPWALPGAVWTADTLNAVPLQYWGTFGPRYLSTTSNGVTTVTPFSQLSAVASGSASGYSNWFADLGYSYQSSASKWTFSPSVVAGISTEHIARIGSGLGTASQAPALSINNGMVDTSAFEGAVSSATNKGESMKTWSFPISAAESVAGITKRSVVMFGAGWSDMGADFMGALTASQLGAIAHAEDVLGATQLGYLSANQLIALRQMDWSRVSAAQLNGITLEAFSGLQSNIITAISEAAWRGLDKAHTQKLNAANIRLLSASKIGALQYLGYALTASVGAILTANQVASIQSGCWAQVSDTSFLNALPLSVMQSIAPSAFASMSTAVIAGMDGLHLGALTDAQALVFPLSELNDASVAFYRNPNTLNFNDFLNNPTVNWARAPASFIKLLTLEQLKLLHPTQMAQLSLAAIAGLTRSQTQALTLEQIQAFNTAQLSAAVYISRRIDVVSQIFGVFTVTRMSTAFWSRVDSSFLNALSLSAFAAITSAQMAAISSDVFAGLDKAHFDAFTITQLLALTARQVGAFRGEYLTIHFLRNVRLDSFKGLVPEQMRRLHDYLFNTVATNAFADGDPVLLATAEHQFASLLATIMDSDDGREAWLQQSVDLLIRLQWLDVAAAATLSASDVQNTYAALNWSWMSGSFLNSITTAVFSQVKASSVAQLNLNAVAALNDAHIQALTVTQAAALSGEQLSAITHLGALQASVVQSLSELQIAGINQDWSQISNTFLSNMTAWQFAAMLPEQFAQLTYAQLSSNAIDWGLMEASAWNALSLDSFSSLCSGSNPAILQANITAILGLGSSQMTILAQASQDYNISQTQTLLRQLFGSFNSTQKNYLLSVLGSDSLQSIVLQVGLVNKLAEIEGTTNGVDTAIQTLLAARKLQPSWFQNVQTLTDVLSSIGDNYTAAYVESLSSTAPASFLQRIFGNAATIGNVVRRYAIQLDLGQRTTLNIQQELSTYMVETGLPRIFGRVIGAQDANTYVVEILNELDNTLGARLRNKVLQENLSAEERKSYQKAFDVYEAEKVNLQTRLREQVYLAEGQEEIPVPIDQATTNRTKELLAKTLVTDLFSAWSEKVLTSALTKPNLAAAVGSAAQASLALGSLLVMLGGAVADIGRAVEAPGDLPESERQQLVAAASLGALSYVAQGLQLPVTLILQAVVEKYTGQKYQNQTYSKAIFNKFTEGFREIYIAKRLARNNDLVNNIENQFNGVTTEVAVPLPPEPAPVVLDVLPPPTETFAVIDREAKRLARTARANGNNVEGVDGYGTVIHTTLSGQQVGVTEAMTQESYLRLNLERVIYNATLEEERGGIGYIGLNQEGGNFNIHAEDRNFATTVRTKARQFLQAKGLISSSFDSHDVLNEAESLFLERTIKTLTDIHERKPPSFIFEDLVARLIANESTLGIGNEASIAALRSKLAALGYPQAQAISDTQIKTLVKNITNQQLLNFFAERYAKGAYLSPPTNPGGEFTLKGLLTGNTEHELDVFRSQIVADAERFGINLQRFGVNMIDEALQPLVQRFKIDAVLSLEESAYEVNGEILVNSKLVDPSVPVDPKDPAPVKKYTQTQEFVREPFPGTILNRAIHWYDGTAADTLVPEVLNKVYQGWVDSAIQGGDSQAQLYTTVVEIVQYGVGIPPFITDDKGNRVVNPRLNVRELYFGALYEPTVGLYARRQNVILAEYQALFDAEINLRSSQLAAVGKTLGAKEHAQIWKSDLERLETRLTEFNRRWMSEFGEVSDAMRIPEATVGDRFAQQPSPKDVIRKATVNLVKSATARFAAQGLEDVDFSGLPSGGIKSLVNYSELVATNYVWALGANPADTDFAAAIQSVREPNRILRSQALAEATADRVLPDTELPKLGLVREGVVSARQAEEVSYNIARRIVQQVFNSQRQILENRLSLDEKVGGLGPAGYLAEQLQNFLEGFGTGSTAKSNYRATPPKIVEQRTKTVQLVDTKSSQQQFDEVLLGLVRDTLLGEVPMHSAVAIDGQMIERAIIDVFDKNRLLVVSEVKGKVVKADTRYEVPAGQIAEKLGPKALNALGEELAQKVVTSQIKLVYEGIANLPRKQNQPAPVAEADSIGFRPRSLAETAVVVDALRAARIGVATGSATNEGAAATRGLVVERAVPRPQQYVLVLDYQVNTSQSLAENLVRSVYESSGLAAIVESGAVVEGEFAIRFLTRNLHDWVVTDANAKVSDLRASTYEILNQVLEQRGVARGADGKLNENVLITDDMLYESIASVIGEKLPGIDRNSVHQAINRYNQENPGATVNLNQLGKNWTAVAESPSVVDIPAHLLKALPPPPPPEEPLPPGAPPPLPEAAPLLPPRRYLDLSPYTDNNYPETERPRFPTETTELSNAQIRGGGDYVDAADLAAAAVVAEHADRGRPQINSSGQREAALQATARINVQAQADLLPRAITVHTILDPPTIARLRAQAVAESMVHSEIEPRLETLVQEELARRNAAEALGADNVDVPVETPAAIAEAIAGGETVRQKFSRLSLTGQGFAQLGFALFASVVGIAAGIAGIIYAAQSTKLSSTAKILAITMNAVRIFSSVTILVGSTAQIIGSVIKAVELASEVTRVANASFALGNVIGITTNIAQIGLEIKAINEATDSSSRLLAGLAILDATIQLILNIVGTIALAFGPIGVIVSVVTLLISVLLPSAAAIATAVKYRESYDDLTSKGLFKEAEVIYVQWQTAAMDASPIVNWTSSIYTPEMKKAQERSMDYAWMDKSGEERLLYALKNNTDLTGNFDSLRAQIYAGTAALNQPFVNLGQGLTRAVTLMLSQESLSYFEGDKLATVKLAATFNYLTNTVSRVPKLVSAAVNGQLVTLTFNQNLASLNSQLPNLSAFTVKVAGAATTVSGFALLNNTITLTLASAVTEGQLVTFSYSDTTTGDDSHAVQNMLGKDAASITDHAVVNRLDADHRAPLLVDAVVEDKYLSLLFDEALDSTVGKVPDKSAFAVTVAGSNAAIESVAVSGQRVLLTLVDKVAVAAAVSFNYTAGEQGLRDTTGNKVAALSAQAVDNTSSTATVTASRVGWLQYDNFVASTQGTGSEAASVLNGTNYTVYADEAGAKAGTARLRYLSLSNAAGEFDMYSASRAVDNSDRIWLDASSAQGLSNFAINTNGMTVSGGQGKNSYSLSRQYANASYIVAANSWSSDSNVVSLSGGSSDSNHVVNLDYLLTADNISGGLAVAQTPFKVLGSADGLDEVIGSADNQSYYATSNVANVRLTGANANVFVGESATVNVGLNGRVLVDMDMWRGLSLNRPTAGVTNATINGSYGSYSLLNLAATDTVNDSFIGKLDLRYQIGHLPALGAFTVNAGGADVAVTQMKISGSKVTLSLASAVQQNQAVRVSYHDASTSNDADTLQDLAGNDVSNFSAQLVSNITADTTAPTLKVATVQGSSLIVRFSEALQQAYKPLPSAFKVNVNNAAVAVSKVVFNDSSSLLLTLATAVSAGQTVTMNYSVASDTTLAVQDLAGNTSSNFIDASVVNLANVAAAPSLRSVRVNGNILALSFDGTLRYTLNDASAFLVTVDNTPMTISSVSVVGTSVLLYLDSAVTSEQSVEVSYTAPQQVSDTTTLRDWLGNRVGNLSPQVATNITGQDLTAPTLQYAIVNASSLVLTFSEALNSQAGFTPVPSAFAVSVAGSAVQVTQAVVSGATVTLSLATAVNYAAAVSLSYTDLSAGNDVAVVQDLAGNDTESFSNINVVNNTPDTTAPTLLSATVTENQLVLSFDESLNSNSSYLPALTSMSVNAAGVAVGIVSGSLNGGLVILTLSRAVNTDDYVTFSYNAPSNASNTQAFQDVSANHLLSIANFSVSNLTGLDLTSPSVVSAEVNGNALTLTFSEGLASTASFTPSLSAFSVYVDGTLSTISTVTLNGTQAQLSLDRAVNKEQIVTVSYTSPNSQAAIQDGAGNLASSFSRIVVNNVTVDTSAPTLSSASVAGALLTLTFSETLAADTTLIPSAKQFTVNVDGTVVDVLSAVVADKVVTVTLNKAVTAAQAVSIDYTPAATGTNQLQDTSGNATVRFSKTASNWTGLASIQNATVSGTQLTLTFNQELDAMSGHLPPVSAFAVQVAGVNSTVSQLVADGYKLTLTLDAAVNYGQAVTVNYTDPSTANDVAALQNLAGMDVQTFSTPYAVHNLTPPVVDLIAPSLNSAVANGSTVTLTFSEALDAGAGEWLVNYLPNGQYDAQGNPVVTSRLQASGFVNVLGSNSNDSFIIGDQSGLAASRQLNYIQLGNGQGVKVSYADTSGNLLLAMGSTGQADVVLESGSSLQKLFTNKLVQSDADIVKYKANRDTITLKSLSSLTALLAGYEVIDATEASSSLTAQIGEGDHQIKLGGQTVNLQFDKVVSNTSITTKLIPNSWMDYQAFKFNDINADGLWVGRESDGTVLFQAQWAGSGSGTTEHLSVNYDGTLSNVVFEVGHVLASESTSQLRLDKLIEVMATPAFASDSAASTHAMPVTDSSHVATQTKLYRVTDIVAYSAQPQSSVTG